MFCREYLVDMNGTKAAERAGYSEDSAASQASRLLRNDNVAAFLKELIRKRAAAVDLSAERVLAEIMKLAFSDLSQAFNDKGELKSFVDMPEDIRRAIAGVEVDELYEGFGKDREQIGVTKKIKLWDKPKSLEMLARHLKLLTDKVEHSGKVTLEQMLAGSNEEPHD